MTISETIAKGACLLVLLLLPVTPAAAASLTFSVNTSEPVAVSGTPRLAIDVGGVTRYATYAAGSGSTALTFSYAVQTGDFDANGIALVSPLELNGGSIADAAGNPANPLTFSLPDTSALRVQTYTTSFTTSPITSANANAVAFSIAKAPTGASFNYTITSSEGSGSVTGSGTISGSPHSVSNLDVSALPSGTLTLSVTVSTAAGGTGAARTATASTSFTGVLDSLTAASAAFSTRRLSGSYAGPLMRVRRASDNSQQDIGATIAGALDTASLTTFCGVSSCFVSTLYDQSDNARHAVQATTARQPRIVNSGTLESEGGRPALRFAAAGPNLAAPAIPGQSIQGSFNGVFRVTDTSVNRHPMGDRVSGGTAGRAIRVITTSVAYSGFNVGGAIVTMVGSVVPQRVVSLVSAASTPIIGTLDGAATTGSTNNAYGSSGGRLWIGADGDVAAQGDWVGTISEVTVFNVALSTAQRQALERNQGAWYGISVQ